MGIMAPVARLILREHARRPLEGTALLIGRQSVPLTIEQAEQLVLSEGIPLRPGTRTIDSSTRDARQRGWIDEKSFSLPSVI